MPAVGKRLGALCLAISGVGCKGHAETLFTGALYGALLLVLCFAITTFVGRINPHWKYADLVKAVIIALLLGALILMLVLLILRSGIGSIG